MMKYYGSEDWRLEIIVWNWSDILKSLGFWYWIAGWISFENESIIVTDIRKTTLVAIRKFSKSNQIVFCCVDSLSLI